MLKVKIAWFNFNDALDVMQNRGIATMQTVPYTSLEIVRNLASDPSWRRKLQISNQLLGKIEGSASAIKKNISQCALSCANWRIILWLTKPM